MIYIMSRGKIAFYIWTHFGYAVWTPNVMLCHGCFNSLALIMPSQEMKKKRTEKKTFFFNELNESEMENKLKAFHKLYCRDSSIAMAIMAM